MKFWTPSDRLRLRNSKTYADLANIALCILKRMPQPIGQVCGPITTGGVGTLLGNLREFRKTIRKLQRRGLNIFNQMPFEGPMQIIRAFPEMQGHNLLVEFYLPIFQSGLVKTLYFHPDWRSSGGATWEHEKALELKMEIVYL